MARVYMREVAVLCLSLAVMILETTAVRVDLSQLLGHGGFRHPNVPSQKRVINAGNPCTEPDQPWPCHSTSMCLPMGYVCDDNYDCEDGSDEDQDMCTAKKRPPVEEIESFLLSQRKWVIKSLFESKPLEKVAHGLAVSQTVDDFKRRLKMSSKATKNLRSALKEIMAGNEDALVKKYRMPKSAWNEVSYFFSRLIKAGFE